ncbi:MAG: SDR family oxidoreductase [Actinomycetota bacterium]
MSVVAVTGVAGYLGQRLLSRLEADRQVERVIGVDVSEPVTGSPKLEFHQIDVRDARLSKRMAGVSTVVHLAFQHDPIRDEERMGSVNVEGTANLLAAASEAGVSKIVYPSSSTVYGAHPDNDFPLTEESPLRANEDFAFSRHKLETEDLVRLFRQEHPGVIVTLFRSAVVFGPGMENFVSRMLEAPRLLTVKGHNPPMQFVHEDDVASALAFAVETCLDGVYNLAADGWLSGSEVAALAHRRRVELPEAVAFSIAERLWRAGLTVSPPGELHYIMHPWVVDNSKLRAAGWTPQFSNKQALLEAMEVHGRWVAIGRARVRKESAAKGTAVTLGAAAALLAMRRARRSSN